MRWRNITTSTLSRGAGRRWMQKARCRSTKMGTRSGAEPGRMLKGVDAWITKQRKDQSLGTRANIPVIQVDYVFGDVNGLGSLIKWNPVANVDGKGLHRLTVPSYQVADGLYNHVTGDGSLVVYGVGWPTRWGSSALMLRKPFAQKELEPVKFLFFHEEHMSL